MRNHFYPLTSLILVSIFALSFSGSNLKYPNGAPAGYTGSPGDGQNCTSCHNGGASAVFGWITSNVPTAGYTPGVAYTITITVSGSGSKGFEASPQNATGTLLGTLIAGTGSKLVGGNKYVTHSSAKNSNPAVWTFTWTAPAAGAGLVTIYGAMTVSKPVTKLSTLIIPENINTSIPEPEAFSFRIFPNPAREKVTFNYQNYQSFTVKFDLLNTSGQVMQTFLSEFQDPGEKSVTVSIKDLVKPGAYFIRMAHGTVIVTKKLVVL